MKTIIQIQPLIFSAVGTVRIGRETSMVMLTEVLWELDYKNLKHATVDTLLKIYESNVTLPLGSKKNDYPIIFIPKINNEEELKKVLVFPNVILFHVKGNSSLYSEDNCWINNVPGIVYPVRNDGSFKMLKLQIQSLFINEVMTNNKIWKSIYS